MISRRMRAWLIQPGLKRAEFTQRLKDALDPATQRLVAEGRAAQGGGNQR